VYTPSRSRLKVEAEESTVTENRVARWRKFDFRFPLWACSGFGHFADPLTWYQL
jgi:hypothetical protein